MNPSNNSSLNYELQFSSGIVQTFGDNGSLVRVNDSNSGLVSNPDKLTYTYAGVQEKTISGQGVTTTLGYNTAGEQTSTSSDDGSQTVADTIQSQDDQDNPKIITATTTNDGTGGTVVSSATDSYAYANGNETDEIQSVPGVTTHYDYYPVSGGGAGSSPNALADIKLMQGSTVVSETDYAYNAITGRLQTITVNGTAFTVSYLSNSNVVQTIGTSAVGTTWTYNTSGPSDGDLQGVATNASGTTLDANNYTYNANDQQQTAITSQLNADGSSNSTSVAYAYDSMDELTKVTDNTTSATLYSYNYDGVGNQTGTSMGTANSLNEYSSNTYNQRGDLTNDGTYVYTWNAADQLTAVTAIDNSVKVTYAYDGQGRRVEKTVYDYEEGEWSPISTRKFVYDGSNLVEETDGSGNAITGYAWGPQGLMAVTDYTTSTPIVYMAMLDGQGNVTGLANASTGAVAATYTYDPYGKLLTAAGPAANVCNVLYKQGYTDREVGLNYFQARYESASQGRWISEDPAGVSGGSNVFAYCGNDPVDNADPSGLAYQWVQKLADGYNAVVDATSFNKMLGYWDAANERMRQFDNDRHTIGNLQTWDIINAQADISLGDPLKNAVKNPAATHAAWVNTATAAMVNMDPDAALRGWSSSTNWKNGTSYIVLTILGPKDALEAGENVDLASGQLIDPTDGWNENRILRMNNGIGVSVGTAAGLAGGYNRNLTPFKLAPVKLPPIVARLLRDQNFAAGGKKWGAGWAKPGPVSWSGGKPSYNPKNYEWGVEPGYQQIAKDGVEVHEMTHFGQFKNQPWTVWHAQSWVPGSMVSMYRLESAAYRAHANFLGEPYSVWMPFQSNNMLYATTRDFVWVGGTAAGATIIILAKSNGNGGK